MGVFRWTKETGDPPRRQVCGLWDAAAEAGGPRVAFKLWTSAWVMAPCQLHLLLVFPPPCPGSPLHGPGWSEGVHGSVLGSTTAPLSP